MYDKSSYENLEDLVPDVLNAKVKTLLKCVVESDSKNLFITGPSEEAQLAELPFLFITKDEAESKLLQTLSFLFTWGDICELGPIFETLLECQPKYWEEVIESEPWLQSHKCLHCKEEGYLSNTSEDGFNQIQCLACGTNFVISDFTIANALALAQEAGGETVSKLFGLSDVYQILGRK